MGFYGLNRLLSGIESDIAWGIVEPLYFEMWVSSEIVSDFLVRHVIDPMQVPGISSDLYVFLSKVDVNFAIEISWVNCEVPAWLTLISGKNLSFRS